MAIASALSFSAAAAEGNSHIDYGTFLKLVGELNPCLKLEKTGIPLAGSTIKP